MGSFTLYCAECKQPALQVRGGLIRTDRDDTDNWRGLRPHDFDAKVIRCQNCESAERLKKMVRVTPEALELRDVYIEMVEIANGEDR